MIPYKNDLILFLLSSVIGILVVKSVKDSLHSPLMSLTNAISSIIFIGMISRACNIILYLDNSVNLFISSIMIGLFLCATNIVGGLYMSYRILKMMEETK